MSRNVPGPIWHPGSGAEYNVPTMPGQALMLLTATFGQQLRTPPARPRLVLEEIRQTKLITIKLPCLGRFQG